MLLPPPEITSSPRPGTGNTILSGLPTNPPAGGSGMLPAVLVLNPNQMPGPPPPPPPKPKVRLIVLQMGPAYTTRS